MKIISNKGMNATVTGFMTVTVFILLNIRTFEMKLVLAKEMNCNSLKNHEMTIEDKTKFSPLVLHVLAVYTNPSNLSDLSATSFTYSAHFWLISVYKGAEDVAKYFNIPNVDDVTIFNIHDRKINVSEFVRPNINIQQKHCWRMVRSQIYYILFAAIKENTLIAFNDDKMGAIEDWTEENEMHVWHGLGWSKWSDWAACSVTCGEGVQERQRFCTQSSCVSYNKEKRKCNMFPCHGALEPLATDNQKYFHPSRSLWEKVPDRKSAWRIKSSYYLWLPAAEVAFPVTDFQKHFALIVSVRINPTIRTEGTIFSLKSRSQPNSYLSLNIDEPGVLRLIQSKPNGTQSVIIPAAIADGHWHQLALGIQDNVSVRSYLDCRWVSTDILKNNSLTDTNDADLVIGYLFAGDLEHLILVPDSGAVVQQCSTNKISYLDKRLLKNSIHSTYILNGNVNADRIRRRHHPTNEANNKRLTRISSEINRNAAPVIDRFGKSFESAYAFDDDEDNRKWDGSGSEPIFEMEWSNWSKCNASCGTGIQTRHLRCINLREIDEPCPLSKTEYVETRQCKIKPCITKSKYIKNRKRKYKYKTDDFLSNVINVDERKFNVLKKHRIHEEDLDEVTKCKCINGGTCQEESHKCKCPDEFTGNLCEISIQNICNIECQNGGTCIGNKCICFQGYTGHDCSSQICELNCEPGEVCPPVTTCDCNDSAEFKCNNTTSCRPCLNGGLCSRNTCKCLPGWTGIDCSIAQCKPTCKNGGYCIKPNECLCRPGTTGNSCENDTCGSGCLNDGVCVGYGICKCPSNVTGNLCETILCDPPCENGATCITDNICLCTPEMNHPQCAKKKCNYKAVKKPYTVGVRRLARRKSSSKCRQNKAECESRLVPKFQTVYRTLYRMVYECIDNNIIYS